MMDREWQAILDRYGQSVELFAPEDQTGTSVRAFLQPVRERGEEQLTPSPLGLRREDRLLYLGPAGQPLTPRSTRVVWQKRAYEVQSAHPVGTREVCHWWAVLRPLDKEET